MDFNKIKLIIWDLDETLWPGVLSDGTALFSEKNAAVIRDLTDIGIVNSICSKNDEKQVKEYLEQYGLWEYFVFNSINWSAKGERVKQIITEMNLRDENTLFIDDNSLNLSEGKSACPKLMTAGPDIIDSLASFAAEVKSRPGFAPHSRLEQYKLLEQKQNFKAQAGSNEEFLRSCNIHVDIEYDCENHIDRIAELVLRSNQLNFTKVRSSADEIKALVEDASVKTGYVHVSDRFGDYGIVGFFALKDNVLIHFVFSCRTLNMGVEQYVYHTLKCPKVTVVGQVASTLSGGGTPDWINSSDSAGVTEQTNFENTKILFKGPCDMGQIFSFIKESKNIVTEFNYVNDPGVLSEGGNHTAHIIQSLTLSKQEKDRLATVLPFGDGKMYETRFFDPSIGIIVYSLFTDPNLGLYRDKNTGTVVAFGEWTYDLTDESIWDKFINAEVFVANCKFNRENLKYIKDNYEFLGRLTPQQIVDNLEIIYDHLPSTTALILNLGNEVEYEKETSPAYIGRHLYNRELNKLVREWAKDKDKVYLLDVSQYIKSQDDFTNGINHFQKQVYYYLSKDISDIVASVSPARLKKANPNIKRLRRLPQYIVRKMKKFMQK